MGQVQFGIKQVPTRCMDLFGTARNSFSRSRLFHPMWVSFRASTWTDVPVSCKLKSIHAMALTVGERLGPYEILAPIGEGGMGEVYKAHDTKLDREVAIKVLPCGPQESRRALSDLLFQPIIVMQSTEDRLGSDAVTEGKLMPMAACRNIRLDGFRCARA